MSTQTVHTASNETFIISEDQNTIVSGVKEWKFKLSPDPEFNKARECDCNHCDFRNMEFCGDAPCSYRKDKKEGYFTGVIK